MKLYDIADAILDWAAEEHREYNTASPVRIQEYAFNGMDVAITNKEAQKIYDVIKNYLAHDIVETHQRYVLLEQPLDIEIGE